VAKAKGQRSAGAKAGAGGIKCVYVIYGQDGRRGREALEEIREAVLGEADPQLALSVYEGDSASLAEVLDGLRTLPFLTERRLVVIKDADKFISDHREALEKYLEQPSSTGVLLLMAKSFPGRTRLAKKAAAVGEVVACEPVKAWELPKYVSAYARRAHGLTLGQEAATLLVELAGEETGILCGEVDKLATFVGGGEGQRGKERIERADVERLVGNNRQYSVFNVIDAMTRGDKGEALGFLHQLFAQDREAQYRAVGAFAWHFRRLYEARLLRDQGVGGRDIIKSLRIWSQKEAFLRQVGQLSIDKIGGCLRHLRDVDLASKRGASVATSLERLIIAFGGSSALEQSLLS